MANILKIIWVIIAFDVCQNRAASLQKGKTVDLDAYATKEDDGEQVDTYRPIEPEHLTVNESKVVIDLYTPHEQSKARTASNQESAQPFVQLVINQPETDASKNAKERDEDGGGGDGGDDGNANEQINENQTTEKVVKPTASPLQLIPPAAVNATIAQLEKEVKHKQGQIIIRFALFPFLSNFYTPFSSPFKHQLHINGTLQ